MHLKYINQCRLCGNPHLEEVVDLGMQYNQGSFIFPDRPPPSRRKMPARVIRCDPRRFQEGCGLVQNAVTVPVEILYSHYGYHSSTSKTMRDHLAGIASGLADLLQGEPRPRVLDIGCNDFFTLRQFPERFDKVGVDPSNVARSSDPGAAAFIPDVFPSEPVLRSAESAPFHAILTIAMFYDVNEISRFVESIRRSLAPNGIWVCEFAYLPAVMEQLAYDGMIFEHVALYSLATFENAIRPHGLKVFRLEENDTNGGSLQVWVTHRDCREWDRPAWQEQVQQQRIREFDLELDDAPVYRQFAERVNRHREKIRSVLLRLKAEGKRIHAYGMSTKLNTLLQAIDLGPEVVEMAAERNPAKFGARTLSGIPIVSEEESRKQADIWLVGPYFFEREILERERHSLEQGLSLLFPLPAIRLVSASGTAEL